jgi:hypothetical protein
MEQNKVLIKGMRNRRNNDIWIDGRQLLPGYSLTIRNHSLDGFNWGYGGSGPAQAALAILLKVLGDKWLALELYQHFKWEYAGKWPVDGDFQELVDFDEFLARHPEEVQRASKRRKVDSWFNEAED